jgi:DNA-binding FadR family transcriptional regulator
MRAVASVNAADGGLTTAAARTVTRINPQQQGLSAQIARGLAEAIRLGLIPDGERLPPEAQLAEQLHVSPVTLREALATLRAQGMVVTRRGRAGGTFACAPFADQPDLLRQRLSSFSTQELRELGDHRSAISGAAARLAAQRALPDEVAKLRRQAERLRSAATPGAARRADTQFTIEVALAAQSARLTREELRLRAEVGDLLWVQVTPEDHDASVAARTRLAEAIASRDAGLAREVAEQHVAADTRRLLRLRLGLYEPMASRLRGNAP